MYIGKVSDTFDITNRGMVILTDTPVAHLPQDLKLKIGDPIELRVGGNPILQTNIAGLEHCDPRTPTQLLGLLLPREVEKKDAPVGAEVWKIE
jgi:hypothetical protein